MTLLLRCSLALLIMSLTDATRAEGPDPEIDFDLYGVELLSRLHWHDRDGLEDWESQTRVALRHLREQGADGDSEEAIIAMLALLDAPRELIHEDEELNGGCRVRSLQANRLGAYRYPWFDCELYPEERAIVFHKPTGSQRRLGLIGRTEPDRFLFVGGMYFTDELPRGYSGYRTHEPDQDDLSRDSVGVLFRLGDDHYFIGFVPRPGGQHELYELSLRR